MYEQSALAAANLETKDLPIDGSTPGLAAGGGAKKFPPATNRSNLVSDVGEISALPSSASWCVCSCV